MSSGRPWIVAHRGHSAAAPENSLQALERAIEAGADAVECDVRFAGDGSLVVSHDADLRRLTGHPLPVAEADAITLEGAAKEAGASVAPLTTLMRTAKGRVPLMLDVKTADPKVVSAITAVAREVGFGQRNLVLGLRVAELVDPARAQLPKAAVLALHGEAGPLERFLAHGVRLIRFWEHAVTASAIEELKQRGCAVWVTTGGPGTGREVGDADTAALAALINAGADALLVNDPDLGRRAVDG